MKKKKTHSFSEFPIGDNSRLYRRSPIMTPTPSRTDLNLLIASHGKTIHLVKVGSSNSLEDRPVQQAEAKDGLTATVTASLELPNQPSFAIEHPTIPGLIYVTSWIENKLFKIRVDQGGESGKENQNTFKVEAEANTGGGGPTFVLMKPGDDGLLIAHVSKRGYFLSFLSFSLYLAWLGRSQHTDSPVHGSICFPGPSIPAVPVWRVILSPTRPKDRRLPSPRTIA